MSERTVYQCENPACSLGTVGEPGHFTGGITAAQVHLVTGQPVDDVKDHGEGFCPNCGKRGHKAPKES